MAKKGGVVDNLSVSVGKLRLKNPVLVASGTFGYAQEFEKLIDLRKLGISSNNSKSISHFI